MNKDRYELLYSETLKHLKRLDHAFGKLKDLKGLPLTHEKVSEILQDEDLTAVLDQIAYRFSKIQDNLGKLLRLYLWLKGESVENIPMIDVVNLAERYGINISEDRWFRLRALRNALVHEYETQTAKIAQTINDIYDELNYLKGLVRSLSL